MTAWDPRTGSHPAAPFQPWFSISMVLLYQPLPNTAPHTKYSINNHIRNTGYGSHFFLGTIMSPPLKIECGQVFPWHCFCLPCPASALSALWLAIQLFSCNVHWQTPTVYMKNQCLTFLKHLELLKGNVRFLPPPLLAS